MKMSFNSKELLALQKMVVNNPPNKLVYSEIQLTKMAYSQAQRYLTIVNESVSLVNNTVKPDVFFSRYQLVKETLYSLSLFEPYIKFQQNKPSAELNKLSSNEQKNIHSFLVRYFNDIRQKANEMKTDKGKRNKYEKFYSSLQPYYNIIDNENINYIENSYLSAIRQFDPSFTLPERSVSNISQSQNTNLLQQNTTYHNQNDSSNVSSKSWLLTMILAVLFGYIGIHRFYVGKVKSGIVHCFTLGLIYVGWISDIVEISNEKFTDGNGLLIKK